VPRKLRETLGLIRSYVTSLSTRARWVVGVSAVVAVCAVVALALHWTRGRMVPLDSPAVAASDLEVARTMLADRGIASSIVSGRLTVPVGRLAQAREILAPLSRRSDDAMDALSALAEESDLWRTSAQNDKRWQAAKMKALSRLVESFPAVAKAAVLYEPGSPRGLGGGQEPTAAVKVTMRPGATLTRTTAGAIADLVAGSVAGLDSRNVRVIDSSGRSYRFDAAGEQAELQLQQRRAIETRYHEKIHAALAQVDKLVIGVSAVGPEGQEGAGLAVSLAVPRSYLPIACGGREDPSSAAAVLAAIRQTVLAMVGDRPCQVTAGWYYDADAAPPASALMAAAAGRFGWPGLLAFGAGCAAGGLGAGWLARGHRTVTGRRRAQPSEAPEGGEASEAGDQAGSRHPWAFLDGLAPEDVLSLVAAEHPQTIAIVLGQLPPPTAAAVLAALGEDTQAVVARRVAMLHQVDPVVITEVARTLGELAGELAKAGPQAVAPEARVAEMLRHAGHAAEQVVLSALAGQAPSLAEAVRRRLFRFEDIAQLPADRLRAALAGVETAELAVALRTASEEVKAAVLAALAPKAARQVRQDMERMVPVRLIEVEAAQQHVAESVRRAESGEYVSQSPRQEKQLLA
jgi:flagellar motor switch protein FliG/type III secretory pathway lipoprotein EscJ